MNLNLEYLAAFIDVYEQGSFAKAASKSSQHASTFSRKISALEDYLGFNLFVRYSRYLEPTEQAKALYDHAKAFLTEANLFDTKVNSIFHGHTGSSVIVIDTSVIELGMLESISQLIRAMPSVKVTIKTGDTESVRTALVNGEADMAFALATFSLPAEINGFRYLEFPLTRVATQAYLEQFGYQKGKPISPSTIRSMTQVVMTPLRNLGVESQVYSHNVINSDSFFIAREIARHGAGWSNLPSSMVEADINSGEIISFDVEDDFHLAWSVELLWSTEKVYDPIREQLIKMLE